MEKAAVEREERDAFEKICHYAALSFGSCVLAQMSQIIQPLFSPSISRSITPFLVPAVHSSVSLLISSFLHHTLSLCLLKIFFLPLLQALNTQFSSISTSPESPSENSLTCIAQILIISHSANTQSVIRICC